MVVREILGVHGVIAVRGGTRLVGGVGGGVVGGSGEAPAAPPAALPRRIRASLAARFRAVHHAADAPVREAAQVLERAGDIVRLEASNGSDLLDVPSGIVPNEDTPAPPRLLPMWDSVLLAYADRSRVIPPDYRRLVIRQNGDTLPTLLIDGFVAGVWRPVESGIEVTAFDRLSDDAWDGLAKEAAALVAFLADRDPAVYRRYGHWWKTLPSAEGRVLPG